MKENSKPARRGRLLLSALLLAAWPLLQAAQPASQKPGRVDFNRDIRPILSGKCFACHGPDAAQRKGSGKGLRLDTVDGQRADNGEGAAVMPGKPDSSTLIKRVITSDLDDRMPPPKNGKALEPQEIALLRQWISEGAEVPGHWAYIKPVRPALPRVSKGSWPVNGLDHFILAGLDQAGLKPQPEADRYTLGRRVALDITGLPPNPADLDAFVKDRSSRAYERWVDKQLASSAYGEHWARMWLDLARYADSAGYADDPPRTIWRYRDYVIQAFNRNITFDQFTREQIAGDLLPDPSEEQLVATAFHRNTMTNNEGGTSDEEFRSAAIVDRVNTTFAVWMGTSMACAQCHTHKYDPISQKEYFQLYAFFNNTADADRPDESPVLELFTSDARQRKERVEGELQAIDHKFKSRDPELVSAAGSWARVFPSELDWESPRPSGFKAESGASLKLLDDGSLRVDGGPTNRVKDTYTVAIPFDNQRLITGVRLEALADDLLKERGPGLDGNFVVRRVKARILPVPNQPGVPSRYVRIELPARRKLRIGEIEVFSGGKNIAVSSSVSMNSTDGEAAANRAVDGRKPTESSEAQGFASSSGDSDAQWLEMDLKSQVPVERIVLWSAGPGGPELDGFRILLLDSDRREMWERSRNPALQKSVTYDLLAPVEVLFGEAGADFVQAGFDESEVGGGTPSVVAGRVRPKGAEKGWAVGGSLGRNHSLRIATARPVLIPQGATLEVSIEQQSKEERLQLGRFRLAVTTDSRTAEHVATPAEILAALAVGEQNRKPDQTELLNGYFIRHIAPALRADRERHAALQKEREGIKPYPVPVMRELEEAKRRKTLIQLRGNYQITSDEVHPDVPAAWPPLPSGAARDRKALADWLVSPENPLTARVVVNRFWEQIFGIGLVRTSEEFGAQGDLPSNQALLDWLACEFRDGGWDMKKFLKLLVMSRAYRQSSRVTPEALEKDPENRLVSRAPRFRMGAEVVRDQALAVAGLLSPKQFGPSVRPPRPNLGLNAAFGGNLDWKTSDGEDRYRRGLYTEWRRTSPYPSMATFDAPSREVCTLRRNRSNTPLQALVTLNDPVFVEASRGLAERMIAAGPSASARIRQGYMLALSRPPSRAEQRSLAKLQESVAAEFSRDPARATSFVGSTAEKSEARPEHTDLAAWTAVAGVILNLDETLMRR